MRLSDLAFNTLEVIRRSLWMWSGKLLKAMVLVEQVSKMWMELTSQFLGTSSSKQGRFAAGRRALTTDLPKRTEVGGAEAVAPAESGISRRDA